MRLKSDIIDKLEQETKLPRQMISDYINRHRYPSRKRAILLEQASIKAGIKITKEAWVFSSKKDLKETLTKHITKTHN
ncbi:MAG: hypothetical protein AB7E04_12865 [Desulfobacteraceae bacterium]